MYDFTELVTNFDKYSIKFSEVLILTNILNKSVILSESKTSEVIFEKKLYSKDQMLLAVDS